MSAVETPPRESSRARVWSRIGGPLLAAGTAAAIEALSRGGFGIPNPPAILLLIVVFSAFLGGLGSGLATAIIAWGSFLYFFSTPGHLFHYTDDNLRRVVVWAVTTPLMAIMVGVLKRRAERGASRDSAALAERAAERRRAEWAAIVESTEDAIIGEDLEFKIQSWNAGAEKVYGYAAAEVIGRSISLLAPPDRADEIPGFLDRLRHGERLQNVHTVRVRKDGSRVHVALTISPIRDAEGNIVGISTVARDITAYKRHEEARNLLVAIVESSDDAIIGTSVDGIIRSWNAGAERTYGYSAAEVVGRPAGFLAPPDRPDEIPRLLERVARGERVERFETIRMRKDGSRIDISLTVSPLRDAAGTVIGVSAIARDISARKRHEKALRESEERYRGLFNGIPVGLYRAAIEGEILEANPAFLRILGFADLESLRAQGAQGLYVDPEARQRWIDALEREGVVSGFESQLRRVDGSVIWVAASARIVRDPSGGASYLEGAIEDITERKEAQEAMLRAREADRANQAKSEFLSRMSHELRTPLNAILGFGQLLEIDSLSPKQHEYVDDILKGGRHLLELINEVLDITRIEAGRLTMSGEPVSVREIVQESLALIAPLSARENITVEDGTDGIPEQFVLADRQRLKQVLLNLLSNAVKYNRRGGLVAVSCESMPAGRLRIKVSDTGPGIPAEKLGHLFLPFERLGAENTAIEGTGLGLALSKRLIGLMGGVLGVESVVGRGTTFWVDLVLAEVSAQREGTVLPDLADLHAPRTVGSVLHIEDNLSNVKLVQNLIALRPEVKLIPAMQGRLGLDLAREHHPDLILLDVNLPDMPGSEVLRRLKDAPDTHDIPVVVISADATRTQLDRLLAAGARAYLTKPLDVKKLLAVLDEILTLKAA